MKITFLRIKNQRGFTMIELLLAMTLFSFVLVLSIVSFVQINRIYHKSNTISQVQATSRRVITDISRSVRVAPDAAPIEMIVADPNPTDTNPDAGVICIGDVVYEFRLNWDTGDSDEDGLSRYERIIDEPCANQPTAHDAINASSTSLLDTGFTMRDIVFESVDPEQKAFRISITVSFGEDDLFEGATAAGSDTRCTGSSGTGGSFCAVSSLETTVLRRL